jgi:ribose transport system substrate-binding protein
MMKSTLVGKLAAALVLAAMLLSGCGAPAAQPAAPTQAPEAQATVAPEATATAKEQLFVGFAGVTLNDNFQLQLWEGMQEKADELGIKLVLLESNWDVVKQTSDIEDFLTQGVDALIVSVADADGIVPSIEKANAAGVPVFTIDSSASGGDIVSHSGNDLYCIGVRSMEYLADQFGGKGKVLHMNGVPGLQIVTWNDDGVNDFVADHPDIQLVQQAYGNWDAGQAQAITEDVLTAHPDLAGVYVISEIMTPGVIQAIAAAGLSDKVKVMNGGYAPESQQWLADGKTVATMEWASKDGAAQLMQNIYDYLTAGKAPPTFVPWPVVLHTQSGETLPVDCPIPGWTP